MPRVRDYWTIEPGGPSEDSLFPDAERGDVARRVHLQKISIFIVREADPSSFAAAFRQNSGSGAARNPLIS